MQWQCYKQEQPTLRFSPGNAGWHIFPKTVYHMCAPDTVQVDCFFQIFLQQTFLHVAGYYFLHKKRGAQIGSLFCHYQLIEYFRMTNYPSNPESLSLIHISEPTRQAE